MADDLGSGIALDQELDFIVDATGDLEHASGVDEVRKDLAFNLIRELSSFEGRLQNRETEADAEIVAQRTILNDPRVAQVQYIDARFEDPQTLAIEAQLRVESGETFTNVFTLSV